MANLNLMKFFDEKPKLVDRVKRQRPKSKRQIQLEEAKERAKTRKSIEGYGDLIDLSKDISNLSLDEAHKLLNAISDEGSKMRDLSNTHDLPISWAEYRRREEALDEYQPKAQAQFQKRINEREAKLKKKKEKRKSLNIKSEKKITKSPNNYPTVPAVWEHTMAIQAMKYKDYKNKFDIKGWLMSEKLDGYRALWDGNYLWTNPRKKDKKTGKLKNQIIEAPEFFTKNLPSFAIDGELWIGLGTFNSMGVARMKKRVKGDKDYTKWIERWKQVRYMVFDSMANPRDSFDQRYTKVMQWFKAHPVKHVIIVKQTRIQSINQMKKKYDSVLTKGGEGLMIRDPLAPYIPKRNKYILKVKPSEDEEAIVLGYSKGEGRLKGSMIGALEVINEAGCKFSLGSGLKDKVRKNPPKIGTIITYTFTEKNPSGKPRHARFFRIRNDGYIWKGK